MPERYITLCKKEGRKVMLSDLVKPVIRNPVYVFVCLIFVVVSNAMANILFFQFNIILRFMGIAVAVILSSVLMACIGNLLKQIHNVNMLRLSILVVGVRSYFLRLLGFNILISVIFLFVGPVVIPIFKPLILMGGTPQTLSAILISVLISPFFILWYPAMVLDNLGILQSIKKATTTGKKVYLRLALCVLISLLPFFFYIGLVSLTGSESVIGYYLSVVIVFIISLFSMVYLFDVYMHDSLQAHNII
jgi:hypothetical protein